MLSHTAAILLLLVSDKISQIAVITATWCRTTKCMNNNNNNNNNTSVQRKSLGKKTWHINDYGMATL
jgi:hypothetical protein